MQTRQRRTAFRGRNVIETLEKQAPGLAGFSFYCYSVSGRRKIGDAKEKSAERESTVPFSLVASPLSTPAMKASTIEIYNNHGILGASVAPVRLF